MPTLLRPLRRLRRLGDRRVQPGGIRAGPGPQGAAAVQHSGGEEGWPGLQHVCMPHIPGCLQPGCSSSIVSSALPGQMLPMWPTEACRLPTSSAHRCTRCCCCADPVRRAPAVRAIDAAPPFHEPTPCCCECKRAGQSLPAFFLILIFVAATAPSCYPLPAPFHAYALLKNTLAIALNCAGPSQILLPCLPAVKRYHEFTAYMEVGGTGA